MPVAEPSAAAPAPPMIAPAPAAMNGAAKPPVRPRQKEFGKNALNNFSWLHMQTFSLIY